MAIQTDVTNSSASTASLANSPGSFQLFNGRFRIKQILFVGNTTSTGYVTIYDSANNASITGVLPTPTPRLVYRIDFHTSNVPTSIDVPGEGLLFQNGAYVVFTNLAGFSVNYG